MKLLVPWLRKSGFWGHSRSPDPKFGVFVVTQGQNMKIFEPTLLYNKMKLCIRLLRKSSSRGHMRSPNPTFRRSNYKFGGIFRQILKLTQSVQIIEETDTLGISFLKEPGLSHFMSLEVTNCDKSLSRIRGSRHFGKPHRKNSGI